MKRFTVATVLLLLGAATGYVISESLQPGDLQSASSDRPDARKVLYWVAPMDPNFRRDAPGKSPMGMNLVPVYSDQELPNQGNAIRIDPAVVNNLGVVTVAAQRRVLRENIRTVGRIEYDKEKLVHVHLRVTGWIHKLSVRTDGERVRRGDRLFDVYSPDLVKAQAEFLQALTGGRTELVQATRQRLRALGISDDQVAAIERDGKARQHIAVFAPASGVIAALNVADGKFVTPDSDIMIVADLDNLWLMSDVFESHAGMVEVGAEVRARMAFGSGEPISTRVDYVYPSLDPVTRTIPVRALLRNPDLRLKPGMFMTVTIDGADRPPAIVVPATALIRTGTSERVIVSIGDGQFIPAAVRSGIETQGMVEIVEGLNEGESVVVSGQFLLDSESSFAGAALRLSAPGRPGRDDPGDAGGPDRTYPRDGAQ